jgi:hypothetical protein
VSDPTETVRARLGDEHTAVLDAVSACADSVAADWPPEGTTSREAVVPPFRRALDASGVLARLPRVLSDLVTATGRPMPAPPVAAPPYVVVTSEGVVLRATASDGRLVVTLRTFDVERGSETRYVRRPDVDVVVERR